MISTRFCIDADHPALPGHFPGRPVVPGVVLLDRVAAEIEREFGAPVNALPLVKFLVPLLPGQDAELRIEEKDKKLHFRIVHAGTMIASGIAETSAASGCV
jgi:3-hydroxyacyl-[acyl-carrier-protein] dehydratase